jgi:hypothetical protein
MMRRMALTMVICETMVIVILTMILLTPKEKIIKLSQIFNLKYKIILVER